MKEKKKVRHKVHLPHLKTLTLNRRPRHLPPVARPRHPRRCALIPAYKLIPAASTAPPLISPTNLHFDCASFVFTARSANNHRKIYLRRRVLTPLTAPNHHCRQRAPSPPALQIQLYRRQDPTDSAADSLRRCHPPRRRLPRPSQQPPSTEITIANRL